ncbi:MAG: Smr/MutS family protein [Gemmatimonadetes bacterium]|nr:Smr/MutS family protein [Gemmatimonadota bacterium]
MPRKRRRPPLSPGTSRWDSPYPTLDLHGETADAARSRAERWLRSQQAAGERTVRIITGRGLHSIGPPVLPAEIDHLLTTLKGPLVATFEAEPAGGVYSVELTRLRAPAPPPRRPTPPADPALRLRAEESLAELGVTPTEELLAAEMERLRGG